MLRTTLIICQSSGVRLTCVCGDTDSYRPGRYPESRLIHARRRPNERQLYAVMAVWASMFRM